MIDAHVEAQIIIQRWLQPHAQAAPEHVDALVGHIATALESAFDYGCATAKRDLGGATLITLLDLAEAVIAAVLAYQGWEWQRRAMEEAAQALQTEIARLANSTPR